MAANPPVNQSPPPSGTVAAVTRCSCGLIVTTGAAQRDHAVQGHHPQTVYMTPAEIGRAVHDQLQWAHYGS